MAIAAIRRITERLRRATAAPLPVPVVDLPRVPQAELAGSFRFKDGPKLRSHLFGLIRGPVRTVVLDCSRVVLMDGCGLAVMLEFISECRNRHVRLKLIDPSRRLMEAFQMYGLGDAIDALCEHRLPELDSMLIVIEDDFPDSIRLPAAA